MIDRLNQLCKNTFISFLGIKFLDYGKNYVNASMPVEDKLQPMGILHGGASLALAETVASCGSFLLVDPEKYDVFGFQVSGNHVSTVREGLLYAKAQLIHKGRTTHVWDVKIRSDKGKLISVTRVTTMIVIKETKQP